MDDARLLALDAVAESAGPAVERADGLLHRLRTLTPFDAAWLAVVDPLDGRYRTLASADLDDGVERYLAGPAMAAAIATTRTNATGPHPTRADLFHPTYEFSAWTDRLAAAGFGEALAVALYSPGGQHVGFLALLWEVARSSDAATRRDLDRIAPVLARGVDPLRTLTASTRTVDAARAGATLWRDGSRRPLPGLDGDPLLTGTSPVVEVALAHLADGEAIATFLWPCGGSSAEEFTRVTVLAGAAESDIGLLGAVVLSPAHDVLGLTPRELQVLGLVIDGLSNHQIARVLVVSPRTVATHLEHVLTKLDSSTRTLAAVRAQRLGLYVPSPSAITPR